MSKGIVGFRDALPDLLTLAKKSYERGYQTIRLKLIPLFILMNILVMCAGSSCTRDEQVSRYQAELNEKEMGYFFDQIRIHLSIAEDKRLLQLQQAAINDLAKTWRYDEQYVIAIDGRRSDIDLTIYFNKDNPRLIIVYIAGSPKESLDILIKKIETQCKIHFKAADRSVRPKR